MLSAEAVKLSKDLNSIRVRVDRAKDDIVTAARFAVLALKDTNRSLAEDLERRIFVLDSENSAVVELLKADNSVSAFVELLSQK